LPTPGKIPRRVAIDRKIKEYAKYNIEELLLDLGIDYNNNTEVA
jgi:dynein heavy chain